MIVKTRSAVIELRPNGVIYMSTREDWDQPDTLEVAKENMTALKNMVDGKRRGLISELPNTHLPKEVMEFYQDFNPGQVATALMVNSFGAKVMGNLFLKLAAKNNSEPVKLFSKESEAEEWLLAIINQKQE